MWSLFVVFAKFRLNMLKHKSWVRCAEAISQKKKTKAWLAVRFIMAGRVQGLHQILTLGY